MTDIKVTATFYDDHTKRVIKMTQEAWDNIKANPRKHFMDMAHDFRATRFEYFVAGR